MTISVKCPNCGKRVFEGEVFVEEGEKLVELSCFSCAWTTYKSYDEWKQKLAQAVARRNAARA